MDTSWEEWEKRKSHNEVISATPDTWQVMFVNKEENSLCSRRAQISALAMSLMHSIIKENGGVVLEQVVAGFKVGAV